MSWSSVFVSRFPSLPWSSESSQWKPTWNAVGLMSGKVRRSTTFILTALRLHDCSLTPRPLELSWTVDTESKLADVSAAINHSLARRPSPLPKKISRANPLLCHILQWWCTLFYQSCIRPHLEYACTVWDPYFAKEKTLLHGGSAKVCLQCCKNWNMDYESMLGHLNIPTLQQRRLLWIVVFPKLPYPQTEIFHGWIIISRRSCEKETGCTERLKKLIVHLCEQNTSLWEMSWCIW